MINEAELVEAARRGDAEAFGALVNTHSAGQFRIAMHILRHREDAEDAVQSAFLSAFRAMAGFRGDSRFSTWLARITTHECLSRFSGRNRWQSLMHGDTATDPCDLIERDVPDWSLHPEKLYAKAELDRLLRDALDALPLAHSLVFVLRDIEGLTTEETAAALKLTVSNVKVRLMRARLQLRRRLSKHFASRASARTESVLNAYLGTELAGEQRAAL